MRVAALLVAASLLIAAPAQQALAHGGGLDRHGCHHETATGGYHCHRGEEDDDPDWETAGAVLGGLVAVGLLIYWLKPGAQAGFVADDSSAPESFQIKLYRSNVEEMDGFDYLGLSYKVRF